MNDRVNRRKFLSINLGATVGFLGNFLSTQFEQNRDFFRPPGALNELEFLTSCTRCGKCKNSCPEGIINLFAFADGAKLINTPYLNPNESPCTFCMECIEVCPTNALSRIGYLEETAIGKAEILTNRCLAFQEVMCDYCVRSCPVEGALTSNNGLPKVFDEICIGCGICVSNCISEQKGIHIQTLG